MGVVVLSLAAIPLGVLAGSLRDPLLARRSRFWLRFAALMACMVAPWFVALLEPVGEEVAYVLLLAGLGWSLVLVALAHVVLFRKIDSDPGPSDDGPGPGGGPDDGGPTPDRPIGGLPLPDAEPPRSLWRGPHRPPRRPARVRRPAREPHPARQPSRLG